MNTQINTIERKSRAVSPELVEKVIELRKSGMAVDKIGEQVGKCHQWVTNLLKKHGAYSKKETVYNTLYEVNKQFFKVIDSEAKAYILGFICADGHIDRKAHRIQFSLSIKDEEILYKIKELMESTHPISHYLGTNPYKKSERVKTEMCKLSINSKELVDSLSFFPDRKTYNLTGSIADQIPTNLLNHFLRGYFDGDGHLFYGRKYGNSTKYLVQVTGTEAFLRETFGQLLESQTKMYKEPLAHNAWCWRVCAKSQVDFVLNYLYKDAKIYLDRKFKTYQSAHVKPIELLESYAGDNGMPISSEASQEERSETIERLISEDQN